LHRFLQVEEAYRSAESLAKAMGIEANPVLRYEVPLLQGLKFDLVVHSPYRALAGLFKVGRLGRFACDLCCS
jgi:cyclin H